MLRSTVRRKPSLEWFCGLVDMGPRKYEEGCFHPGPALPWLERRVPPGWPQSFGSTEEVLEIQWRSLGLRLFVCAVCPVWVEEEFCRLHLALVPDPFQRPWSKAQSGCWWMWWG